MLSRMTTGEDLGTLILVAEDGGPLRSALERMLASAGHEVETVANGDAALERLLDGGRPPVNLLLADINLPGRTGPEVIAEARRALESPPATVLMSGSLNSEDSAVAGGEAILAKPFDSTTLLNAVDRALARRDAG
jgi:two-component system, response regulator FlrC